VVRGGIIGIGIIFLIIAFAGYTTPISVTLADTTTNLTIPKVVAFCDSGIGQFSQMLAQVVLVCSEHKTFMMGIYGSGLLGIILIIVGAVVSGKKEALSVSEKKLERSGYVCEHCAFIGRTEGELLDHYNEKHPDEKKW